MSKFLRQTHSYSLEHAPCKPRDFGPNFPPDFKYLSRVCSKCQGQYLYHENLGKTPEIVKGQFGENDARCAPSYRDGRLFSNCPCQDMKKN